MKTKKFLTLTAVCALIISISLESSLAVMVGRKEQAETYAGDYVVASNTSFQYESEDLFMSGYDTFGQEDFVAYGIHPDNGNVVPSAEEVLRATVGGDNEFNKGDKRTFTIKSNAFTDDTDKVEFVCTAVGTSCYVWTTTDASYSPISSTNAAKIVTSFDRNASRVVDTYGKAYLPGQMLSILCYDINDGADSNSSSAVSGFFRAADYTDNGLAMVNVDTYPTINNGGIDDLLSSVYHEFTHLICYSTCCVLKAGKPMDTWFTECLAISAEQLIMGSAQEKASLIWNNCLLPTQYGRSLYEITDMYYDYPMFYLFGEYVRINGGGYEVFAKTVARYAYMTGLGQSVQKSLTFALADTALDGLTLDKINVAFRTALLVRAENGLYGFGSSEVLNTFDSVDTQNVYSGTKSPATLTGGAAVVYSVEGGRFTAPEADDNIVFTVIRDGVVTVDCISSGFTVTFTDTNDVILAKVCVAPGEAAEFPTSNPQQYGMRFVGWTQGALSVAQTARKLARVEDDMTVQAEFSVNSRISVRSLRRALFAGIAITRTSPKLMLCADVVG